MEPLFGRDTSTHVAQVQLDLLRRAGSGRRAALACSLSRTVIDLSRAALRAQMPDATEREVLRRWIELSYGEDLAARVSAYLQSRGP